MPKVGGNGDAKAQDTGVPEPGQNAPRTGRLARTAIAGAAAARMGVAQLGHKAKGLLRDAAAAKQAQAEHDAQLGRIVFAALNQLKGTALKASQLLSMELGLLPPALRQELARAHYQVTPLNRALVIKVLRQELGAAPEALFQHFEPQAFAAASLGQVHAAKLAGDQPVAVKLQYPGMAHTVASDMQLLRGLLLPLAASSSKLPNSEIVTQVLDDIERKLADELDYTHEAQALEWFAEHLCLDGVVIPLPVPALCTRRVLTMQRLQGLHLQEWLQTQPSQAQRDHCGQLLFDCFMRSAFALHHLHADPHPGNYLFMEGGRLGLLDFGCTRVLDAQFCAAVQTVWSALLRSPVDVAGVQRAYVAMGLIRADVSAHAFASQLMPALASLQHWQCLPFTQAVYDFAQHPAYPEQSTEDQQTALQFLQTVAPDMPYFDRAYLGLVQMLKAMAARVRTTNPWIYGDQFLEKENAVAPME